MNVYGVEIPEDLIVKAIKRMQSSNFRCVHIESVFYLGGVKYKGNVATRAADRLIQQQRKKGLIKYENGCWSWVGEL